MAAQRARKQLKIVHMPDEAIAQMKEKGYALRSKKHHCKFLVKEYGFTVYATDLWSDPAENIYWKNIISFCKGAKVISISEMESNEEVWNDWLKQDYFYFYRNTDRIIARRLPDKKGNRLF